MRHEEHVNESCFVTDVPTATVCTMKTFQNGIAYSGNCAFTTV